jgi:hypothetical protein
MPRERAFLLRIAGLLTVLFVTVPSFASDTPNEDADELVQMVRAAKATFKPIDPQRQQDNKASLVAAVEKLDRFMMQSGPEVADGWKVFLDWQTMQTQVHSARPDWQALHRVLDKYYQDHAGLELLPCIAVREKLRRFIATGSLLDEPRLKETYEARLDELEQRLEEFRKHPSGEQASAIGRTLSWLQDFEPEGPRLAEAVRARYSRTNGFGHVSATLVNQMVARDANDRRTIREYILRTSTVGPAQTEGQIVAELIPNPNQAVFDIRVTGNAVVNPNIGYRGAMTIYTSADTQIDARKRVLIDVSGVGSQPAQTHCKTDVRLHSIEAPRTIMEFIARRMASRKNPEAEQEGSQRAEARTSQQLDVDADGLLSVANHVYQQQFRAPLVRLGAFPSSIPFSSTEHHLRASLLLAGDSQFGAWSPPPRLNPLHDLGVCMHESLVNNFCETLLGGKTFKDTAWLEMMQRLTADAPKPLWVHGDSQRWSTVLSKHRPLTVEFADDRCLVTIRLQQFNRGDDQLHRPLQIRAEYQLQAAFAGPRMMRQGDLQIALNDGGEFTQSEAELLAFVRQKFEGVLLPELAFEFALPTEKLSSMELAEFSSHGGWLTIGYQLTRSRLFDVANQRN